MKLDRIKEALRGLDWIEVALLSAFFVAVGYQVATAPAWRCGLNCVSSQ